MSPVLLELDEDPELELESDPPLLELLDELLLVPSVSVSSPPLSVSSAGPRHTPSL